MRAAVAVALCLFLGACANQQQLAAQRAAQQAALNAEDDNTCRSYGAQPGSDQYINCRMMLSAQRNQTALAQQQMAIEQQSATLNTAAALIAASGPR